ncbi:MAG: hypothetical protein KDC12_02400 [Flavobacteriales bacterium]|nr:hypothetical protein [Flavobacteriales bacterium]
MNKILSLFAALLLTCSLQAQSLSDLFQKSDTEIHWLGIDYSQVKLIGDFSEFADAGDRSVVQVKETYFPKWNYLIVNESAKYDIRGMVRKEKITNSIEMVMKRNGEADVAEMEAYTNTPLSPDDIQGIAKTYDFEGKTGLGLILIAECMDKNAPIAIYHFAVINMNTKEVLLQERFETVPGGIGLRNFWAASYYKVIQDIEKNKYKAWKKEYGKD